MLARRLPQIASASDPAVDVARITELVAGLCKRLSTSAPAAERLNLMRATVHFYTEVSCLQGRQERGTAVQCEGVGGSGRLSELGQTGHWSEDSRRSG